MYMTRKDWWFFYCRLEKNSTFFQHRKFLNTKSLVWGISPSAFLFKTFIVQKSRARFGCLLPLMQYLFKQLQSNMWYVPSVEMGQFFFALRFFGQRQKILSWLGSLVILLIMLGFDPTQWPISKMWWLCTVLSGQFQKLHILRENAY